MDSSNLPLVVAAVAAMPPLLALVITVVRDAYLMSGRARKLDEARRLTEFVKSYADALVAVSNQSIADDVRDELESMLHAATSRGKAAANAIRQRDQPKQAGVASIQGLLLPRWPKSRMAQCLTMMYYYSVLAAVGELVFGHRIYERLFAGNEAAMPLTSTQLLVLTAGVMFATAALMRRSLLDYERRGW